jgi:hypothetical protein
MKHPEYIAIAAMALATVVGAVQLWGIEGVPIATVVLSLGLIGVVALGRRTDRLAETDSDEAGHEVFYAVSGGWNGQLHVLPEAISSRRGRSGRVVRRVERAEVDAVLVARKGSLGKAALVEIRLTRGSVERLEVNDGDRFLSALAGSGWPTQ